MLRVWIIEARSCMRFALFNIFERLKDTSKLMEIEKTIPNTVNNVCSTAVLPHRFSVESITATEIAIAIRIINLIICGIT